MKRYLLFGGEVYGNGGWLDFRGDFDTVVDALRAAVGVRWWQVVDAETRKLVHSSSNEPENLLMQAPEIIDALLNHEIVKSQAIQAVSTLVRKESVDMSRVAEMNGKLKDEVDRLKILLEDARKGGGK